jgi:3-hydroxybutyryl-CoA dehydratase
MSISGLRYSAQGPDFNSTPRNEMAKSGLDTVKVGDTYRFAKTVGETDIVMFAGITGDFSDTHVNDQYMKERSNLGGRIAHGALLVGYMSTASTISIAHIIHQEDLNDFPVSAGYDKVRFLKPVLLGDTITVTYTVIGVDKERGRSVAKVEVTNQTGELKAVAEHIMRWAKKLSSNAA